MEQKELSAKYNPSEIEEKWYRYWLEHKCFHSEPEAGRQPYTVVIPPPNVTGILHMGHMLNNTIQDVLVRRARMQGKNACWVPGLDHASIATEAKVVAWLKEQGIDKKKLSRDEFMAYAWQWKEKYGGIILQQLRRLGASCDWDRTRFTMDPGCYEAVIDVFVRLYEEGLIYRGVRMVNWDPKALTALSDEEVIYKEERSKLYYLRYEAVDEPGRYVIVATTRPETILGDVAVCVHPEDPRYASLHGKKLRVPIVNREIPVITDTYVDREFGTGCLKITPAHDINDYEIGLKYKLEVIDIFEPDGRVNDKVGLYVGMDRFDLRKQIVKDLKAVDLLEKEEDYTNKVGHSERTDAVIEPKLSAQWFLKMPSLAGPALEVVMDDTVCFHPAKFKNTYRHWMETIKDWCISRQLWWGQRIPAYYLPNKEVVVARTAEDALVLAKSRYPEAAGYTLADLQQDEDVLDTWFSSWLWPMSVFDGVTKPDNPEINYYYPVCDLVTAPDIMFFWVARMIMAGLHFRKQVPFSHVYYTGTVRDKLGRKMSKSLGNSPDPIGLIEKYGADGVRVGMLLTSPAGNDLPFDEAMCEQGRNFCNKIW
ncbi:MAG: valine--tRNA ligase, partial [Bacteroidales bacterium]|nr:valine--tRNA ligase [Bacteroidales bacterium]